MWQGLSRYLAALALIALCWAISIHADDGLSALLQSHYQHSGAAASHRNVDFASQLNLDRDPAEILAEADLSFKAPNTYKMNEVSLSQDPEHSSAPSGLSSNGHIGAMRAAVPKVQCGRDKRLQLGALSEGSAQVLSGGDEVNVTFLKHRIDELTRFANAPLSHW